MNAVPSNELIEFCRKFPDHMKVFANAVETSRGRGISAAWTSAIVEGATFRHYVTDKKPHEDYAPITHQLLRITLCNLEDCDVPIGKELPPTLLPALIRSAFDVLGDHNEH